MEPSKRPHSNALMSPPQGSMEQSLLASIIELHQCLQEGHARSEKERSKWMAAMMDRDWARQDWDVALSAVWEQDTELTVLRAQVAELESRVVREVPEEGSAIGLLLD
ncbi:hypothetical protein C0993_010649, partial [Termitomyces sp. T159_Od127]